MTSELRQRGVASGKPTMGSIGISTQSEEADSSASSTPTPSASSSSEDLKGLEAKASLSKPTRSSLSLKERSRIPASLYMTLLCVYGLQWCSGVWTLESFVSYKNSVLTSLATIAGSFSYCGVVFQSIREGNYLSAKEYITFTLAAACVLSLFVVFFVAPFRAGVWTGKRATRHVVHRFMGLAFMFQYALAWVEFLTDYESATTSHLPIFIAVNGVIQGYSAYFSFKVLPDLDDAGYFSDKAVMSRAFVHENIFFSLLCIWGSTYYHAGHRAAMRAHPFGKIAEHAFAFYPYIIIRSPFPLTRFKDAGTTYKGRSEQNKKFYEIGTLMVKIFYLWAKYFLGFFVNFMVYLDLATPENFKLIHGMFLLNEGTVSLAMFLHTLRFKKILPPKFAFTLYLMQIYATFSGLPMAIEMFRTHKNLCALCLTGLVCNMTRNRKIHAVWCTVALVLMTRYEIDW